ncbi:MAG TPA: hypothetical protein PLQ35_10000 [bacterium]|nr:hypothetical protein [bacterium]HQL62615.1 hypothetical protein [bacterium]
MTPLLLSALVAPGLGQIYRRELLKGILILSCCLVGFGWLFADIFSFVMAGIQNTPLLPTDDLIERATEIRQTFSLWDLKDPLFLIIASYLWGVIDILWESRKKGSVQSPPPDRQDG